MAVSASLHQQIAFGTLIGLTTGPWVWLLLTSPSLATELSSVAKAESSLGKNASKQQLSAALEDATLPRSLSVVGRSSPAAATATSRLFSSPQASFSVVEVVQVSELPTTSPVTFSSEAAGLAQAQDPIGPVLNQDVEPPSTEPLPEPEPPMPLPPPEELLQPGPASPVVPPDTAPEDIPQTITVEKFEVVGSTVFSPKDFEAITADFTNRPITFSELFQARAAVTQLYVENGYTTSGAFIPPQTLDTGVVEIQVIEGRLEDILVSGQQRLDPGYISSRLGLAGAPPLNVDRLLEGLQLLQLDPLIDTISAELAAGVRPGTSILEVEITEADAVSAAITLDNGRSPSVGSFRRGAEFTHLNLGGLGDRFSVAYANTDGSNEVDFSYTLPVSPHNATLSFGAGYSRSRVIEDPFDVLDIESDSYYYEVTYRHPVFQTPTEELALSLTASRRESESEFLGGFGSPIPFPSLGADDDGQTRISALRFAQEWTQRSPEQVLALRSQFSLGIGALGATVNESEPDSRFFSWRGQGQWVRLLAPDTLLVVRGDLQLTGDDLLPQEQIGLGGQQTVRGYRQDQLLTDSGLLASAEVRLPILRVEDINGILHIVPFVDFGMGWNNGLRPNPDPNVLVSTGLGLQWEMNNNFFARLDWGIPLNDVNSSGDSLQENGLYFSLRFNPF
ncbi:MAG: ShlB/FhaC/HecB family hemolysin secretion/activation protein [Cyanobacteria bacterium P01_C01_bin.120]